MHLIADISAHGYGHLAQTAPVLMELARRQPSLRLTVRTALPEEVLRRRLPIAHARIADAQDLGMIMQDARRVDAAATAAAHARLHADWPARVRAAAQDLAGLKPDLLLANVPYLSLAAAQAAGVPALALCSLEWASLYRALCGPVAPVDLFASGAGRIHIAAQMDEAYDAARVFLRPAPSMPMPQRRNARDIGPIASPGRQRRAELAAAAGLRPGQASVLVTMGGAEFALDAAAWPSAADLCFIMPARWCGRRPDQVALESLPMPFQDTIASVDAVIAKPGYGTFVEAAASAAVVGYVRREHWLEQDALIDWLHRHARAFEISHTELLAGDFHDALRRALAAPAPPAVIPTGIGEACAAILKTWRGGA